MTRANRTLLVTISVVTLAVATAHGQGQPGRGRGAAPAEPPPKALIPNAKPVRSCESLAMVALPNTTIESAAPDPNNPGGYLPKPGYDFGGPAYPGVQWRQVPSSCEADINGDCKVSGDDLGVVLASFGECEPVMFPLANIAPGPSAMCGGLEGVDQADLGLLLSQFNQFCDTVNCP